MQKPGRSGLLPTVAWLVLLFLALRCLPWPPQQPSSRLLEHIGSDGTLAQELAGASTATFTGSNGQRHAAATGGAAAPAAPSRVLVTGAAGFIGYHTARALAARPGTWVLGLDNFSHRPPHAHLQHTRAALLRACCNVSVVTGDVGDAALLQALFARHHFTQVVHLAAQPGVRVSMAAPQAALAANVGATLSLLEVMRAQPAPLPPLVYASSSSVYGMRQQDGDGLGAAACATRAPPPPSGSSSTRDSGSSEATAHLAALGFGASEEGSEACGAPVSVYAATKLAMEKVVGVYSHLYGLQATGLRFFTVYGPLGRPDMAVMGFATALLHRAGEPLTIPCFTGVMGAGRHHGEAAASAANQHDEAGDAVSGSDGAAAASSREDGQQNAAVGMSRRRGLLRHEARMAVTRAHTAQQHAGDSITGLPAPPVGCIPPYRDFTAVSDVVRGILAACGTTAAAAPGQHRVLNLGRGQPQSIMTLLALLQQLTGRRATRVTFKAVPAGRGNADVLFTWADMTRASAALGVTPHVDLADGLQEVVDALLAAPQPL